MHMIPPLKTGAIVMLTIALAYWGVIFYLTHTQIPPHIGGGGRDKIAHFVAYGCLALLLCASAACFWRPGVKTLLAVVGLASVYGVVDETTQMLVSGRTASVLDWRADVCGALMGVALFAIASRWLWPKKIPLAQGTTG